MADKGDKPPSDVMNETEREKEERRAQLLQPENLQRLLADALTYQSPVKDLQTITRCGANVNGPVKRGLRPLHYAVHAGYLDGIRFLLEHGADVNAPDDIGYRPVHLCARKGLLEPLKLLIEHGAKVDFFCESEDDTEEDGAARSLGYLTIEPLNMALENGHVEVARLLLSQGARPDHQYFLGYEVNLVPLENLDCLRTLLEFGADPNVFSRCGLTPLMKACRHHNIRVCRVLLEHGAKCDLQPPSRFEQKTALHFAILSNSNGICNMLLRHGALVSRPPGYRYSALHTAIVSDQPDLCELILRWDGQVEEATDERSTPLQMACATPGLSRRVEIVEVLLRYGANPNANSPFVSYSSPYLAPLTEYMRCATDDVSYDLIRLLLLYGAKVHFRASSTSNRIRDPHGILHCVQYVKDKPRVFHLLLSAATRFEPDSISAYTSLSPAQREVLQGVCERPRDLRTLSHLCLRDHLRGKMMQMAPLLPVPNMVKDFLLFRNPPVFLATYT
ncbi:ankyrin repeat and SOCS box protein 18 [Aplysia californica]|uniref:Ankyrin repeat and SOCS box protein 18 n=1 Tax=Aplysia californica TaxID=6500 RepID=A0ABM0ZZ69_APLCA|nr:ankyrin repeat and SOCS box protein 18 [Aplysia californica]